MTRDDGASTQPQQDAERHDEEAQGADARQGESQGAQRQDRQPQAPARAAAPGGVLPNKAAEDDPRRWGDQPGSYDHDAWLQEQKPPHWG